MKTLSALVLAAVSCMAPADVGAQPSSRTLPPSVGSPTRPPAAHPIVRPASEAARRAEALLIRQRLARSASRDAAFWQDVQRLEALGPAEVRIAVEQFPGAIAVTPYKRVGEWAVAEDERVLGLHDRVAAEQAALRSQTPALTTFALVPRDRSQWWPSNPIPFEIDEGLEEVARQAVLDALGTYERLTPVRFRARRDSDSAYIKYVKQLECCGPFGHLSSMTDHVGRRGGENTVKVQTKTREGDLLDRATLQSSMLHETGHILGLYHEQNRPDRERFLRIDNDCIDFWYGISGNFSIEADSLQVGPYDFDSIMHYPSSDGQKGPPWDRRACTTMVKRSDGSRIPRNTVLSRHDINAMHHLYGRDGVRGNAGDNHGFRLLAHDFDGDGFADLAVGVPGRAEFRGSVHLYKGTASGFVLWKILRPDDGQDGESFGWSLAAGDFDGDGVQDLAVGAPRATVAGKAQAGRVHLFRIRGDSAGDAFELITKPASAGAVEVMDRFGFALEAGRFLAGAPRALAIGAPGARWTTGQRSGRAWLRLPGQPDPMTEVRVSGAAPTRFGQFGFTLGKLSRRNSDGSPGLDSLVVAAPGVTLGGCGDPVVYTTRTRFGGLETDAVLRPANAPSPAFCPQDPGLSDATDSFPNPIWDAGFGATLASGDFNGDGTPDLAVGGTGRVHTWISNASGTLVARGAVDVGNQASFGSALAAIDLDGDTRDDLLVGAPQQAVAGQAGAGVVHALRGCRIVLRSCPRGLRAAFRVTQDDDLVVVSPGLPQPIRLPVSSSNANDRLGMSLAAWQIPGEALPRFAAGSPGKSFAGEPRAGAVFVFVPTQNGGTPFRNGTGLNQRFETRLERR